MDTHTHVSKVPFPFFYLRIEWVFWGSHNLHCGLSKQGAFPKATGLGYTFPSQSGPCGLCTIQTERTVSVLRTGK